MQVTPSHKPQASKPSIAAALLASGKRRAGSGDVLRMVLRESLVLVAVGTLPGLVAAWGLTRFISTMLYGLKPNDPLTIAAATLVMIAAATLAAYLPARHASRIEPMEALRHE